MPRRLGALQALDADKLEQMVDQSTLKEVVESLGNVCYEKAEHIQSNWQDRHLSKKWQRAGKLLDGLASKLRV